MSDRCFSFELLSLLSCLLILTTKQYVYGQAAAGGDGLRGGGRRNVSHNSTELSSRSVIAVILIFAGPFAVLLLGGCFAVIVVIYCDVLKGVPGHVNSNGASYRKQRKRRKNVRAPIGVLQQNGLNVEEATQNSSGKQLELCSVAENDLPIASSKATETSHIFQSGAYNMRYYEYGRWHGYFLVQLQFKDAFVRGDGTDDVGAFDVTGTYFVASNSMTLTKQYHRGTGNSRENFGHQAQIDLKWNEKQQTFDGKWTVRTETYYRHDNFELELRARVESV